MSYTFLFTAEKLHHAGLQINYPIYVENSCCELHTMHSVTQFDFVLFYALFGNFGKPFWWILPSAKWQKTVAMIYVMYSTRAGMFCAVHAYLICKSVFFRRMLTTTWSHKAFTSCTYFLVSESLVMMLVKTLSMLMMLLMLTGQDDGHPDDGVGGCPWLCRWDGWTGAGTGLWGQPGQMSCHLLYSYHCMEITPICQLKTPHNFFSCPFVVDWNGSCMWKWLSLREVTLKAYCVCVCVCVCLCVCVCVCVCECVCVCVCVCACTHVHNHQCACIHPCVHACACIHLCMCMRETMPEHYHKTGKSRRSAKGTSLHINVKWFISWKN